MAIALPRRRSAARSLAAFLAAAGSLSAADAFATPSARVALQIIPRADDSGSCRSGRSSVFLSAKKTHDDPANGEINILDEFTRPLFTAATSAFLAASLLFSNPLLPPPDAHAAIAPPSTAQTATSIDIDLRSLPALTRRVIVNREELTTRFIDAFKSFKPILELLSESNTVTVKPPKDVKGAINQALTKGDATFLVNGEAVDVRVESVPGAIFVRVTNPRIPRLPFLRDGTAALKFVDEIVDVAPAELEKAAEEVQVIEKFLMWGAPQKAPIQYSGSSLDYFLSSKFMWNGEEVSLGALGALTNSEVVFLGVGTGVAAAYGFSYSYYMSLQEEAEREAMEKEEEMAAKKKAKAAAEAKKKKENEAASEKSSADEKAKAAAEAKARAATEEKAAADARAAARALAEYPPKPVIEGEIDQTEGSVAEAKDEAAPESEGGGERGRKRDAVKKFFGRGRKD